MMRPRRGLTRSSCIQRHADAVSRGGNGFIWCRLSIFDLTTPLEPLADAGQTFCEIRVMRCRPNRGDGPPNPKSFQEGWC
jgi:hypothetical protein